jgi:hypothetical protein
MNKRSNKDTIIPTGEFVPPEEEVINIQGIQGESIFYFTMSACVSPDMVAGLQQKIDETLERVRELNDDRLLVLVGALIVENAIDELLAAIMPGFKSLQDKRDVTFSIRIEITKALQVIPTRILNCADFVRRVRNDFIHDLSIDTFDKLTPSELQSMRDRLRSFNSQVVEDNAKVFSRLVLWITIALYTYTIHVSQLNDFIRDSGFLSGLQSFINEKKAKQ